MSRTIVSKYDIERWQQSKEVLAANRTDVDTGAVPEAKEPGIEDETESDDVVTLGGLKDIELMGKYEPPVLFSLDVARTPTSPSLSPDTYTDRLLKYIPAEVIALYLTLDAIVRSSQEIPYTIHWGIFIFGVIATYLYLWRVFKINKQLQLTVSVGAFTVCVFAIGGPFVQLGWYLPVYGGLLLPMYTFLTAIIEA